MAHALNTKGPTVTVDKLQILCQVHRGFLEVTTITEDDLSSKQGLEEGKSLGHASGNTSARVFAV